jgi:UDP-N-acetyl-alpha-D-muramoyl-L-alanyl-L-glutamate epimerase
MTADQPSGKASRATCFTYLGFEVDATAGAVTCRYQLDDRTFTEVIRVLPPGPDEPQWDGPGWHSAQVHEAARLVFLLAGVSYYKAGAPPRIDLGATAVTDLELQLLRSFYLDGLGEFAYRNGLDLSGLRIDAQPLTRDEPAQHQAQSQARYQPRPGRPLLPFGGGLDSIVSVELTRPYTQDAALFVVSRPGDLFAAIEEPAAVTGWPVVRAEREIDEQVLRSAELGFLNGHVPVTGIISAIAVLAAVLTGRDAVVMSNEWSASSATLTDGDRQINHQFSKSEAFEGALRAVLAQSLGTAFDYFSLLRPFSELWIAERFAELPQYWDKFRSCNRAFTIDPARRASTWCGRCDKCCFIDLILAPFIPRSALEAVFGGQEPLADLALLEQFRNLLALAPDAKPWECVGDEGECRAAAKMAAAREDRYGQPVLEALLDEAQRTGQYSPEPGSLLVPLGRHFVPERYAPGTLLV